ncbi:sulfotransferase domain-containing protein [Roseovarius faecimaris]|uniref:Sulfotransferase domain-containing protein n=2 Tax=Roseovarius faecimaris TaxID=2494550 RepID=A0A6I6IRV4_9RHOB|nr:sulfotransferase domain-containing protein [Roseovarius faecimaris]
MTGFLAATARFATGEGYAKGLRFRPRASDVIISPYAKCGTTWMQQIVHGLRTGGDMAFAEITEVVPWIELAHDLGIDLEAEQAAEPRAFKSHLRWQEVPKGARYIVVFRDPLDAFLSFFRFMEGWFFERGMISVEAFGDYVLSRPEEDSYWGHAASWWAERDREEVMLLSYERMKRDLPGVVADVARFIGVKADQARLDVATEQAGFAFMKAHAGQFDDNLVRAARDAACGLPEGGASNKVSDGKAGRGRAEVSDALRARFAERWQESLGAHHGLADYQALSEALG